MTRLEAIRLECANEAREAAARRAAANATTDGPLIDYEIRRSSRRGIPSGSCHRCGSRFGLCRHTRNAL